MSAEESPSYQRRLALRQADAGNTIRVLDSYPLSKYFDLSQRLLDAFQQAVDSRRMDEAYVYGLRFAAFGVESLPKHKDWRKSTVYNKHKRRNAKQVEKVISIMEIIKQRMDAEEIILQERRQAIEDDKRRQQKQKQQQVELEQQQQQQQQQVDERRKLNQYRTEQMEKSNTVEKSALAKLLALQQNISASKLAEKDALESRSTLESVSGLLSPRVESMQSKPSTTQSTTEESKKVSPCDLTSVPTSESMGTTPAKQSPTPIKRKMTPRTSKEQRTIDLLQNTIHAQERRLDEIESTQIPMLVRLAKEHLQAGERNRDAALKCVAHKRSLERQVDVIKAAIFNMETQMFMLENAMEDRQVQKALTEAAQAMHDLQQSAGVDETSMTDLTDLTTALPPVPYQYQGEENDEELLEELQEWISPTEKKAPSATEEGELCHLSLPVVPASSIGDTTTESDTYVHRLMKAVLGD